ncbi:fatty acid desaturase [Rhizobium sp. AC44/96]|uniref:fatty acid desaturase family protein n=1 Tax=Rhizobium sp. AC44/96 TaxID=1841654 RepID=UPI00080F848C|nr:fatty acid desaturase family protein [Rhizobium sp. AC44/96]OCJ14435.1 fatty acid desaturase [Rhizobium sp. AC44/96]
MRDYSLTGPSSKRAVDIGLASAEWYHTEIPRKTMKDLMSRRDGPAIRDTLLWIVGHILFAAGGVYFWGTWWCVPFWAAYGVLYGSACDSRWHECGHGTAFKTRWMNDAVYQIASFQVMRNPVAWRWSHARHHTDTYIVGRDPEISFMRPPAVIRLMLEFIGIQSAWASMGILLRQAAGSLTPDERDYIPESERWKAILTARLHVAIYLATIAAAIFLHSWIPLMLIGLPRIYGCWHMVLTGLLQHGGLADNVIDHRLNSRTVYMNPISRFIYWNMNYHIEHHMFPMVPYHALPRLHALVKDDYPPPSRSILSAYVEMYGAVKKQLKDPEYYLRRELPDTAKPYRDEFHNLFVTR